MPPHRAQETGGGVLLGGAATVSVLVSNEALLDEIAPKLVLHRIHHCDRGSGEGLDRCITSAPSAVSRCIRLAEVTGTDASGLPQDLHRRVIGP